MIKPPVTPQDTRQVTRQVTRQMGRQAPPQAMPLTPAASPPLALRAAAPRRRLRSALALVLGAAALAVAGLPQPVRAQAAPAQATAYPSRSITLLVPFAAGGPTDVVARALGAVMARSLGQSVLIENKTGAGGTLASGHLAKAAPDGYTFLIHHNGMATAPGLYRKLAFNPLTDFEYVGQVVDVPMTLLARKDLPPRTAPELVAYIKAQGNKLSLAHAGLGAVSQLCGMLLQKMVDTELNSIPFQGTAPAMNALLGGQVDILCDQTTQTLQHIKAGNVKLYGVTTRERIRALPDTPTLDEAGLKGFEVKVWHGVYAPKGTPPALIERFGTALRAALKDPAIVQRMGELGAEIVPEAKQTPEGLRSWLKPEIDKWGALIRSAGQYAD
ncbi:tripartite tricarboxylate transporter substrate-binding protein [Aquabacterium sp. OR-4]|uniref:tripartite tricarboxylate transporter substrate-binding protein n=1 Tax=Aquabacterium sp. OR-4 TaxID=2978127 RepID=UPI0021B296D6|nr:tripartite tricarboxylate transporter substrate-binding protein [Aquabacterium sp. OR-4]MDT7838095.1 tripartite tricarboxylate transporter substrate-binding protein [Aquabacterium sp. OR-4]